MSKQPDSDTRQPPTPIESNAKSSWRGGQHNSIKRRVIRLVLIPGIVAVVLWLVASGYLVTSGFYDREVASSVRQVSIPAVTGLSSIERERRWSIAYLNEPSLGMHTLQDQRKLTDERVAALRHVAPSALRFAPSSIKTRWKTLTGYLDQLAVIRSAIDSGKTSRVHVYDFYNGLLSAATDLFDTQAREVPDVTATQGGLTATEIFRVSDMMSRAGSIGAGAFGGHQLSTDEYVDFVNLVGAYHSQLTDIAPHLRPEAQKQYQDLVSSSAWKGLVATENLLISDGRWSAGKSHGLSMNAGTWDSLATAVSDSLIQMTITQADEVAAQAFSTGSNKLWTALAGSLIALVIAIAAIVWAVRQSQVLVDRALSVRLAQLGRDAATAVNQRLPDMMDRLRRHERVDPAVELSGRDYGDDEIGQLADVLNTSLQVAVGAAVDEASARTAGITMLMGVARRPQRPLQHGLQIIEKLEGKIGDETVLAELFDVNHQLAQTRRFLENLVILAGGQTGRRFHKPIQVRRVLLAAIAETRQYQRITVRRTANVTLVGSAVAGTTHLLAELLDNSLAFSPPESEVWVGCSQTAKGVVIEIEDAGVGMKPEDLERANELLATAPTPDVTALKDGSQIGLWVVAELAKRGGIQVSLRTSAYGGLLAIVLLPDRVIADEPESASPKTAYSLATLTASGSDTLLGLSSPTAVATLPNTPLSTAGDAGHEPHTTAPTGTGPVAATNGFSWPTQRTRSGEGRLNDRAGGMMTDNQPRITGGDTPRLESLPSRGGSTTLPEPPPASRPPLPARHPQEHLAPELRDEVGGTPVESTEPARSPEETRARFTRYQQGWRAGAQTAATDNINDEGETGRRDGSDVAE